MATTNITIRMDEELKKQAEELFSDLGLNMTTAFHIFLKQAVREQQIPFMVSKRVANNETFMALKEIEQLKKDKNKKTYDSFAELLEEIENDI